VSTQVSVPPGRTGARPTAPPPVDDLAALWELTPRSAFHDAVRRHLRRALDGPPAGRDIACASNWAARAAIDEVARHPRRDRLRVHLPDRPGAPDDRLRGYAAEHGVALAAPAGSGPDASVVVAFGSLAASPDDELGAALRGLRRWCAPGAVVLWSHSLAWPQRAGRVRAGIESLFTAVDVERVGSAAEPGQSWLVGSARVTGDPR
jgi:hypothetical protein